MPPVQIQVGPECGTADATYHLREPNLDTSSRSASELKVSRGLLHKPIFLQCLINAVTNHCFSGMGGVPSLFVAH
jgi:hypothetical protein